MPGNNYHFRTRWRVESTREEVYAILENTPDVVRWWPSVYLDVQVVEPGDGRGLGKVVRLHTKGWLPYSLRWQCRVTDKRPPAMFALEASGDFVGSGVWTFEQDGPWVNCTYDWRVRADKPVLRYLSFLCRPVFAANHHWAMARGEESLRLELRRRHAGEEARGRVPPPGPSSTSSTLLLVALAGATVLRAGMAYLLARCCLL